MSDQTYVPEEQREAFIQAMKLDSQLVETVLRQNNEAVEVMNKYPRLAQPLRLAMYMQTFLRSFFALMEANGDFANIGSSDGTIADAYAESVESAARRAATEFLEARKSSADAPKH